MCLKQKQKERERERGTEQKVMCVSHEFAFLLVCVCVFVRQAAGYKMRQKKSDVKGCCFVVFLPASCERNLIKQGIQHHKTSN